MSNEMIFRLLTGALFVTVLAISIYFRHRAERQGGQLNRSEGQRLLIPLRLLGIVAVLPLFGYMINPDWVAWARFDLPLWVRWGGALVAITMVPLLYAVLVTIGNNISPTEATRANHQLITSGPYRWIRHPLYTFGAIFFLALSVLTTLWWPVLFLLPGLLALIWRARFEEANLIARFGDEYRVYRQRTGRFLPKLSTLFSASTHSILYLFLLQFKVTTKPPLPNPPLLREGTVDPETVPPLTRGRLGGG